MASRGTRLCRTSVAVRRLLTRTEAAPAPPANPKGTSDHWQGVISPGKMVKWHDCGSHELIPLQRPGESASAVAAPVFRLTISPVRHCLAVSIR